MTQQRSPKPILTPPVCAPTTTHQEASLPKWAQQRLAQLRLYIGQLESLKNAHAVLQEREWFTIASPSRDIKLWQLDEEHPFPICSLQQGDILLVGRAARD